MEKKSKMTSFHASLKRMGFLRSNEDCSRNRTPVKIIDEDVRNMTLKDKNKNET